VGVTQTALTIPEPTPCLSHTVDKDEPVVSGALFVTGENSSYFLQENPFVDQRITCTATKMQEYTSILSDATFLCDNPFGFMFVSPLVDCR